MAPRKRTIEDCRKLAEERGGKCLSEEYVSARTKKEMKKKLADLRRRDRMKDRKIRSHIESGGQDIKYFIRFNYKECITEEYVKQKLAECGIDT